MDALSSKEASAMAQGDSGKNGFSRRNFLRMSAMSAGVLALAACAVPAATPAAAPAAEGGDAAAAAPAVAGAVLNYLSGGWFVPALVEQFEAWSQAWAAENNVTFTIDLVTQDMRAKLAAAIESGTGANLSQIDFATNSIADALVDVSDIANVLIEQGGEYSGPTQFNSRVGDAWMAIPFGEHHRFVNWRPDWFAEAGFPEYPATWDEMLEAGKALKAAGRPFGWTLSDQSPADGIAASLVLLWAYGGKEFNADGTLALDSPETIAALDFAYQLQTEANDPAGTAYQEATNNQAFLAEQISMTYNVNTIYLPALENNPPLAEAMDHALPPEGPGGVHNYTGVATMILLNHTEGTDLAAAQQFMADFFEPDNYQDWVKLGRGYLIPAQTGYQDRDVWDPDPKLAITRSAGALGRVSGFELASPTDLSSIVQAQNVVTRMFSRAASNGDSRAALDAALAEIADLQAQL